VSAKNSCALWVWLRASCTYCSVCFNASMCRLLLYGGLIPRLDPVQWRTASGYVLARIGFVKCLESRNVSCTIPVLQELHPESHLLYHWNAHRALIGNYLLHVDKKFDHENRYSPDWNPTGNWFQRQGEAYRKERSVMRNKGDVDERARVTRNEDREPRGGWTVIRLCKCDGSMVTRTLYVTVMS